MNNSSESQRLSCSARQFLDQAVPLLGASHADVVKYDVRVPTRYAVCFATLADGRVVRFQEPSLFIASSATEGSSSFLFRKGFRRIEIRTSGVDELVVLSGLSFAFGQHDAFIRRDDNPAKNLSTRQRSFVSRDGTVLVRRRFGQLMVKRFENYGLANSVSIHAT